MSKSPSLGYERMFWKSLPPTGHWCVDCGIKFPTFTQLYSHKELWHGKPLLKLSDIATVDTVSGEHPTSQQASNTSNNGGSHGE